MEVSNRSKRRLLGFIASRGGRITSGRNDSVLRWVFEKSAREAYSYGRIAPLERVFEALETDGDVVLERDERGKLFAAHLSDSADFSHADIDADMFEGDQDRWMFITLLLSTNAALKRQLEESDIDAALELAEMQEARSRELEQELAEANRQLAELSAQTRLADQLAEVEAALALCQTELVAANSRVASLKSILENKTAEWASEKHDLRNRLSFAGSEQARLRVEVTTAREIAIQSLRSGLAAALRSHGLSDAEVELIVKP